MRATARPSARRSGSARRRSIRWIRNHYDEPLRIAELAALSTMSASAFHRHFRALTSMTPLQFQKQIRLSEAHGRLLAGADDVAAVGFSVGYASPSQFTREFGRMFETPPSAPRSRRH